MICIKTQISTGKYIMRESRLPAFLQENLCQIPSEILETFDPSSSLGLPSMLYPEFSSEFRHILPLPGTIYPSESIEKWACKKEYYDMELKLRN